MTDTLTVEHLGPWTDLPAVSARSNDLMRHNWAILDEIVRLVNTGDLTDDDVAEEIRDLLAESLDIERKYAATRAAETAEAQRQWYARAFGADFPSQLARANQGGA